MTLDEALQVLHCPKTADWATVQRQYDDEYNRLQRLREAATTREERHECDGVLQAVDAAHTFLTNLPGFGPVAAPEPTLPSELQQALRSPYADIRVGAVRTLGRLPQEEADLAPLARQTLEGLVHDDSPQAAQAAREALRGPGTARREKRRPGLGKIVWGVVLLTILGCGLLVALGLQMYRMPGYSEQEKQLGELKRQLHAKEAELAALKQKPPPPPPIPQPFTEWPNTIGMQFVLIPAGTFQMGSKDEDDEDDEEHPVHQVTISKAFYLGKHEVTQGQWQAIMGNNNPSYFKGDPKLPVENVSWDDVQEFIRRLNSREGGQGYEYKLPTEAQWEYAARAGSTAAYSFGDDGGQLGNYAWDNDNAGNKTHPVGQKLPNAWGLYDMYGNVWEWVQDWYGDYAAAAVPDPQGPSSGWRRVKRGGSWEEDYGTVFCRSAFRGVRPSGDRSVSLGFRLLRTVP